MTRGTFSRRYTHEFFFFFCMRAERKIPFAKRTHIYANFSFLRRKKSILSQVQIPRCIPAYIWGFCVQVYKHIYICIYKGEVLTASSPVLSPSNAIDFQLPSLLIFSFFLIHFFFFYFVAKKKKCVYARILQIFIYATSGWYFNIYIVTRYILNVYMLFSINIIDKKICTHCNSVTLRAEM